MFEPKAASSSFSVDDLGKAKAFYGQTLGLRVDEQGFGLSLHLPGGASVFVYPKPDHQPATFTILGFVVDNIDEAVDDLTRRGVRFEQYTEGDRKTDAKGIAHGATGAGVAWFKDPAGNFLAVQTPWE